MTNSEELLLSSETTALLVVDVQPEYWSNCPSVQEDFPNFPQNLRRTIDVCRQRKMKIIWIRANYRHEHSPWLEQFGRMRNKVSRRDTMIEVPYEPNSPDFGWEDFATPVGDEVIIPKLSWSSTSKTNLINQLKEDGIESVLVCGLITSACVQHSAFGIFEAGFRTLLVEDACADRGRARHDAAIFLYGNYMYEVTQTETLEDRNQWTSSTAIEYVDDGLFKKLESRSSSFSKEEAHLQKGVHRNRNMVSELTTTQERKLKSPKPTKYEAMAE